MANFVHRIDKMGQITYAGNEKWGFNLGAIAKNITIQTMKVPSGI